MGIEQNIQMYMHVCPLMTVIKTRYNNFDKLF